ncbi:MAG TPA: hypothetical protein VF952_06165 [Chloroflexia bacterium]|jgi:hypothetical protein
MDAVPGQDPDTSQVFLVRLWADGASAEDSSGAIGSQESGLHGKVMHVLSGQGSNFNDWPTLLSLLVKMMSPTNNNDETANEREGATT